MLKPQEQREAKILKQSVLKHFQDLEDPRVERGQHHPLVSLVSIAILATLAGVRLVFVAIERYGIAKQFVVRDVSGVTLWDSPPTIPLGG